MGRNLILWRSGGPEYRLFWGRQGKRPRPWTGGAQTDRTAQAALAVLLRRFEVAEVGIEAFFNSSSNCLSRSFCCFKSEMRNVSRESGMSDSPSPAAASARDSTFS